MSDDVAPPNVFVKTLINWRGNAIYAGSILIGWVEQRDPAKNYDDWCMPTTEKPWVVAQPPVWCGFVSSEAAKDALTELIIDAMENADPIGAPCIYSTERPPYGIDGSRSASRVTYYGTNDD